MEPQGSETPIILPSEWTPLHLEILSLPPPTSTPILQGAPTPACDSATHRKMLKSHPRPHPASEHVPEWDQDFPFLFPVRQPRHLSWLHPWITGPSLQAWDFPISAPGLRVSAAPTGHPPSLPTAEMSGPKAGGFSETQAATAKTQAIADQVGLLRADGVLGPRWSADITSGTEALHPSTSPSLLRRERGRGVGGGGKVTFGEKRMEKKGHSRGRGHHE